LLVRSICRPFGARRFGVAVPRVETLGFYEAADFVKTRWKIISFIFDSLWPTSDDTSPVWLWCLIFAVRGFPSAAKINAKVSDCFQRAT
jgi:hypothetical protein